MSSPGPTAYRDLRLPLVLLVAATSVVVATEFIVSGLLPVIAHDLGVSLAAAGQLVGAFALSAALFGPPLTLAAASYPPQPVLIAALLLFAMGDIATVMVPTYSMVLIVRILQGATLPVFIGVGTAAVTAFAPPDQHAQTLARANIGFVIGVTAALPASMALAKDGHWAPPLLALAILTVASAGAIMVWFPSIKVTRLPTDVWPHAVSLLPPLFIGHLLLSVALFAAMFAPYTYLTAWLEIMVGLHERAVALALAGFGVVGLIGNTMAERFAHRHALGATTVTVFVMATSVVVATKLHDEPLLIVPLLGIWGAAHIAGITLSQVRVVQAGASAPALAMAMNISAANLGIAISALLGGYVVNHWGVQTLGWLAGTLAVVVAVIAWLLASFSPTERVHH